MSAGSSFSIYFRGASTLDDAAHALRAIAPPTELDVVRDGDVLRYQWHGGPALFIGLSAEAHVRLEASDLADQHGVAELAACARRFEVGFADLDAVLDEVNTLFDVQSTLQDLTGGFAHFAWSGRLTAAQR